MALGSLVKIIEQHPLTQELIERSRRTERLCLKGSSRTAKALIVTAMAKINKKRLLVIVPTLEDASKWQSLLEQSNWQKCYVYPTSESLPYDNTEITSEIIWGQLQVLSELHHNNNNNIAIVATERSLQPHLPPSETLYSNSILLKKGEVQDINKLSLQLTKIGYEKVNVIDQEGTWSRRGDIFDIFPVSSELPIRIEFFGDEIEKIKEFEPSNQRSLDNIEQVCITPTGFNPLIADKLRKLNSNNLELLVSEEETQLILEGHTPKGLKKMLGIAWEKPYTLLDYLDDQTFINVDERSQGLAHGNSWLDHTILAYESLCTKKNNLNKEPRHSAFPKLHIDISNAYKQIEGYQGVDTFELSNTDDSNNIFDISTKSLNWVANMYGKISDNIKELIKEKNKIWILSAQPSRVVSLLDEHECISRFVPNKLDISGIERIVNDNTPVALKNNGESNIDGFQLPAWKLTLITDKEFFGQTNLLSSGYVRRRKSSVSKKISANKMKPGDYVVHRNHGIGQFQKIEKIIIQGESRDYLVIKYLDGKLSVAADQLGSLDRYRSADSKKPKVNKLGGAAWEKIKERTKRSVKKVAVDLIKLYAERSKEDGFCFPSDGPWQTELEESFPYQPTPDQNKAISEVKKDMEKKVPMDRLVCGDVGFGKTEVAVRAIFKAITAGKQTIFLAPTTVLAQQHWRTISDRFAPYPIKVSLLNRFKSTIEKKEILIGLEEGKIDAVVGTHQLLNKNLKYKDLGLLVIDEEQRFGVNQKEKIKDMKKSVDVLTLSATPIPRTLYMSLSGVREMSLITTPPPQRRSIKTHLTYINDETIRSAICQEIDRGGQVFYIVPRIEGINEVADRIRSMIPNIKLIIAHGQMMEAQLENAMVAFNAGEADLMLCTTIVESGLDIPRVNTILIEDAHKFGLSQLYQLRGRVGRSAVQAHAWLFYPSKSVLNESARQRLKAIQEFTELGSGYQLAMRDMEIRGVGNILGVEQSGQMEAIGFDLYMELLQETIAEIQGQNIPTVDDTQVDLPITAFIPADWIIDSDEKMTAYRSATECQTREQIIELAKEWIDRYGPLPKGVESLLEIMKLKLISRKCGFSRIKLIKPNIILETQMNESAFRSIRKPLPSHIHNRFVFKKGDIINTVLIRGLGVLNHEMLLDQLSEWIEIMSKELHADN